jgi:hypothetical protein
VWLLSWALGWLTDDVHSRRPALLACPLRSHPPCIIRSRCPGVAPKVEWSGCGPGRGPRCPQLSWRRFFATIPAVLRPRPRPRSPSPH